MYACNFFLLLSCDDIDGGLTSGNKRFMVSNSSQLSCHNFAASLLGDAIIDSNRVQTVTLSSTNIMVQYSRKSSIVEVMDTNCKIVK